MDDQNQFGQNQSGQGQYGQNQYRGGQNQYGAPRPMVSGNWTCSQCGAAITELPFEPDGTRPIFCRDCHRQRRANRPNRFSRQY